MDKEGLKHGELENIYNTRLAQELAKWAETLETTEDIHKLLYEAYFVDNSNLSDINVLLSVAENAGLSKEKAREVIEKRLFKEKVDEDWKLSMEMGVTGVPTFTVGSKGVVGFQPYEVIEQLIKGA